MKRVLIGLIFSCMFISACSKNMDVENNSGISSDSAESVEESVSINKDLGVKQLENEKIETAHVDGQSANQENMETKQKITISDILIPEKPYLDEVPFMSADIGHILTDDSAYEKIEGQDGANGHYNYYLENTGIEYVTHSSGDVLAGLILNSSDYSLANGIRVGMTESDLLKTGYPFVKYNNGTSSEVETIALDSGLLRDDKSPLIRADYDNIYVYVGSASEEEVKKYDITGTICYSIVLLMKDHVINKVILDLPTAG